MALSKDPNKSMGMEKRWNRDLARRMGAFYRGLQPLFKSLTAGIVLANASANEDRFNKAFIDRFSELIDKNLVGDWQRQYQTAMYSQTIERTNQRYQQDNKASLWDANTYALLHGLLTSGYQSRAEHTNELTFLWNRAATSLVVAADRMKRNVSQLLHDGFGSESATALREQIADQVKKFKTSALLVSRTEINKAAQRAVIIQAMLIEGITGYKQMLWWVTVNDSHVRHLHAAWHGDLVDIKEALRRMKISPFRCRCELRIVPNKRDVTGMKNEFKAEKQLLDSIRRGLKAAA